MADPCSEPLALFVTVGTATQGFRRLLDGVEALLADIDGEVVAQIGNNPGFASRRMRCVDFVPVEAFVRYIERAEVVVSHAGAGTLIHVLGAGKTPVVMPRRAAHGEIIDDHQLELVAALEERGRVVVAREPRDLRDAIERARRRQAHAAPPPSRMLTLVGDALEELTADAIAR